MISWNSTLWLNVAIDIITPCYEEQRGYITDPNQPSQEKALKHHLFSSNNTDPIVFQGCYKIYLFPEAKSDYT